MKETSAALKKRIAALEAQLAGKKKTGASLNRHGSNPSRSTPRDFLDAVECRFGPIVFDLAADAKNSVVRDRFSEKRYFNKKDDALAQDWRRCPRGWLWLNPPFDNIPKWAKKCAEQALLGSRILFLVPASVGTVWFHDHVSKHAHVIELGDRITFEGETAGFPKDLILCVYAHRLTGRSYWRWKREVARCAAMGVPFVRPIALDDHPANEGDGVYGDDTTPGQVA